MSKNTTKSFKARALLEDGTKKKVNYGNRNRNAGHGYERQIARELRDMGYKAITSRQESRSLDAKGVDLVTSFPLQPQMKCSQNTPDIEYILNDTEAEVIFWKKVQKSGTKFMPRGEYVILRKKDFYNML